jgi:hypothetical protein
MHTVNSFNFLPEIPAQCLSHYYSLSSKSLLSLLNFKCTQSHTPLHIGPLPLQGAGSGGNLIIQSPPPLPLLQLRDLLLHLICIPQPLYYHPPPVKSPHAISNISPNPLSQTRILRYRRINMLSAWLVSIHRRFCIIPFCSPPGAYARPNCQIYMRNMAPTRYPFGFRHTHPHDIQCRFV